MRTGSRIALEAGVLLLAAVISYLFVGMTVAGTLLVLAATVGAMLVLRLIPDSEATAWQQLPPPERAGRRAEVYHLSWQVTGDATGVVRRLRALTQQLMSDDDGADPDYTRQVTAVQERLDTAGPRDVPDLIDQLERLAPAPDRQPDF